MASMPCRTRSRMERAASPSFAGAYASLVWKRKGRQACSRTSPGAVSACTARAKVRAKEKEMEFAATTRGDRAPTATSADSCTGASFHRAALPERVGVGVAGLQASGERVLAVPLLCFHQSMFSTVVVSGFLENSNAKCIQAIEAGAWIRRECSRSERQSGLSSSSNFVAQAF